MKADFLGLKLLAGFQVHSLSLLEVWMVLTDISLEFCSSRSIAVGNMYLIQGYRRVCSSHYCLISKIYCFYSGYTSSMSLVNSQYIHFIL